MSRIKGVVCRHLPTLVVFIAALAIYVLTMAPGITWANYGFDGGELITASVTLGVPHPPGYPTYVLLAHLAGSIPFGEVAWRYNLFSAICMATAAAFVAATAGFMLQNKPMSRWQEVLVQVAAGLSFAFMPLVWSQATISEVYALNMAFLSVFLWALLTGRPAWLVGVLLGLSITSHLTSLLMVPLALGIVPRRTWRTLAAGLFFGLLPFLFIPLFATGDSPVVWGNPTTPAGWWWLVSARIYQPNVFASPLNHWLPRLRSGSQLLLAQFAWVGVFLLIGTLIRYWPENRRRYSLMMLTVVLYAIYALGYDTVDAALFFLPGLLILSIVLAEGLTFLRGAAVVLPVVLLVLNFPSQDLHLDVDVAMRATDVLTTAPKNAILVSPGDQTVFTLWYYQHVAAQRPDMILVDGNLFAFDWYRQRLAQQYNDLTHLEDDDLEEFSRRNQHRVRCDVSLASEPFLICSPP